MSEMPPSRDDEILALREEVEVLRVTNAALQNRLSAEAGNFDVILSELETKGNELRSAGRCQIDLAAFTQRVIDAVGALVIVLDTRGRITRINHAASIYLGIKMPLGDAPGLDNRFDSWLDPNELAALRECIPAPPWPIQSVLLECARHMGQHRGEHRIRSSTGDWVCFLLEATLIYDRQGKEEGAVVSATNIQSMKDAEVDLRLAASVFENSRNGISIANADAVIQRVNSAFTEILGYTLEECVGQPISLIKSGVHDKEFYQALWHSLNTLGRWQGEIIDRHKDGRLVHIWQSITSVRGHDNSTSHYVANILDITEQKTLERDLRTARDQAEAAARAKGDFLANMSHELRTPMNAVLGMAQVGMRETEGRPDQRLYRQILDSGQLLLGVISDILDFSKIEAGKLHIEAEPIGIDRLLDRLRTLTHAPAAAKSLELCIEDDPALPRWISGDFLRITQVLGNLLSNAIKFTAQGRVSLTLAARGDLIEFRVQDSGIGMSEEQTARLFTPFEQADTSTTRKYGGTGLGLAISKQLVELMHGRISLHSQLGTGSTFTVTLPLIPVAAPIESELPDETPKVSAGGTATLAGQLAGYRILAAEDNPVNQMVLEDMLRIEGASLICADDGVAALDILNSQGEAAFDLVLTDIQMPNMDGHELARGIRRLYPTLPVIGLTAHAMAEERNLCLLNGMVEHLTKPVDLTALVHAVRTHARRRPGVDSSLPLKEEELATSAPLPADPAIVDWDALLERFSGRQAFVTKLVTMALTSQANTAFTLRQAATAQHMTVLAEQAHSIKGMAGNLKATRVLTLSAATESAARSGLDEAGPLALTLADALDELFTHLRARLARQ